MTEMLKTLEQNRDLILRAEIGALIHDLGKLSAEFVEHYSKDGGHKRWQSDVHHEILKLHSWCPVPEAAQRVLSDTGRAEAIASGIREGLSAKGWHEDLAQSVATDCQRRITAARLAVIKSQLSPKGRPYRGLSCVQTSELAKVIDEIIDPARWHEDRLDHESMVADDFVPEALKRQLAAFTVVHDGQGVLLKDYVEMHHGGHWHLPELIRLLKADLDGVDGHDSWVDKGRFPQNYPYAQASDRSLIASAFGHEAVRLPVGSAEDGLKAVRYQFAGVLAEALSQVGRGEATPAQVRPRILQAAEAAFRQALGETRRAANDVTLWDHSYSVASLYKAALAQVLLEGKWTQPKEVRWRFLRVAIDGPGFWGSAHHASDMLGRQRALTEALDSARDAIEVEYPLGNEIYRDENGGVFVMPGLQGQAQTDLAEEVWSLILKAWRQATIGDEVLPAAIWNDKPVREEMAGAFGQLVASKPPSLSLDPQIAHHWWTQPEAEHQEICTVCRVRPVGYGIAELYGADRRRAAYYRQAADTRKVCGVCMNRRGQRARDWTRDARLLQRTIWTDEVADDNGRLALVVGRFVLDGWLDGRLVTTMHVTPGEPKNPSPARIRRCWDTTRRFWLDVQDQVLPEQVGQRLRLGIRPANAGKLSTALGRWHTYEADVNGRRMALCWDPDDDAALGRNLFWTTENLSYLGRQLDFDREPLRADDGLVSKWTQRLTGQTLLLYEPGGYLGQERSVPVNAENCTVIQSQQFRPFIPLLAEPATFMALVPADKILAVVMAIRAKYDQEMARVRDRLPLHLGLVFAPRRTPLAALLDAGRAMLRMPEDWEPWQAKTADHRALLTRDGQSLEWEYPATMGDDQTPDIWYPHWLNVSPSKSGKELGQDDLCLVRDGLERTVFIRPSRLDWEFLDTTARRFEITYQACKASRPSRRTRPFLLHHMERLEELWAILCRLEKTQRYQVVSTIEATREDWFGEDSDQRSWSDASFGQFVRDTLAGAAWPDGYRWSSLADTRQQLVKAGVRGELADLIELHMHILKDREEGSNGNV